MQKFVVIFFLGLISWGAFAQKITQTIRGTVTDAQTGDVLPFVNVVILGTEPVLGSATDLEGIFRIRQVPVGRYDISVSFVGYEPLVLREILIGSGKELVLNVRLQPAVMALEEVSIKPEEDKGKALNEMANVGVRKLSVEEARRYAGGFDDPARLASAFAGVSSNVSNNGIIVRGNSPKSLLWRMEGVEIPNPSHFTDLNAFGAGGLTALSSQMLANSDFFAGAFPAEYGNGLSGVFDIYLRNGNNEKREHTIQLGLIGLDMASEGYFKKGKKSSYLFNYRYSALALLAPLLPDNGGGTKYQDLSFKFYFPTKIGDFSLWGLGGANFSGSKIKNTTEWKYESDKIQSDNEQQFGVIGLSHHLKFKNSQTQWHNILAASGTYFLTDNKEMDNNEKIFPSRYIKNQTGRMTFSSYLQQRFGKRQVNKTGIILNKLFYNSVVQDSENLGKELVTVANQSGSTYQIQAYSQSQFFISDNISLNLGLHWHYFGLNKQNSLEPRISMKIEGKNGKSWSFGYGLHSQIDRLAIYLAQQNLNGQIIYPNQNLGLTKSQHFVVAYEQKISENIRLKVEPYFQYLFDVPVIDRTTFSLLNLSDKWLLNDPLVNTGKGRNIGLDLTLERFLNKGYYWLLTASLFNSEYMANGTWYNTRYNRNYVVNVLAGKEWAVGKQKQHILNLNARLSLQGGDRLNTLLKDASLQAQNPIYDETNPFSAQKPSTLVAHLTLSYRLNRPRHSSIWALQVINLLGTPENYGHLYNYKTQQIDVHQETIMIPNLSYKIEF